MDRNDEIAYAELGPRIYLNHRGRELAANVKRMEHGAPDVLVAISEVEDGNTSGKVRLTEDIRAAFRQKYIEQIIDGKDE